jgi:hypothetical protein
MNSRYLNNAKAEASKLKSPDADREGAKSELRSMSIYRDHWSLTIWLCRH